MAVSTGPAAKKLAIAKLRPKLEPALTKQGLAWADVALALDAVDSPQELRAAVQDPSAFLEQSASACEAAASHTRALWSPSWCASL